MKKCLLIYLSFLFLSSSHAVKNVQTELTPVVGYRQDNVKWKLKNGASGQWKSPKFIDYGIKGKTTLKDRYVINYDITLANLINSSFHDSYYLNPAQTSNTAAQKVWSLAFRPNLAFGYKFKPTHYFSIIPQLGFIYDLLYLKTKTNNTGSISSFKDTIQWYGPWIGLDTSTKLARRWTLTAGAAYQLAFYNNSGNWELPPSQKQNKMNQHATGQGVSGRMRVNYEVVKSVSLGAEADIAWQWARSGHDKRNFAEGPTIKSKLSKVNAGSFGGRLTLTKGF